MWYDFHISPLPPKTAIFATLFDKNLSEKIYWRICSCSDLMIKIRYSSTVNFLFWKYVFQLSLRKQWLHAKTLLVEKIIRYSQKTNKLFWAIIKTKRNANLICKPLAGMHASYVEWIPRFQWRPNSKFHGSQFTKWN